MAKPKRVSASKRAGKVVRLAPHKIDDVGARDARVRTKLSAVRSAAKALRADALARGNGEWLGSEEELLARYGVSRPTLRQACALLVQEQLLLIKRGVNGGYYSRQPDVKGVAHTAAIYLQARRTSLREIIQAILPVKVEMAVLASQNRNKEAVASLEDFLARDRSISSKDDYRAFLKSELEFGHLLGEMCANNVLKLFLETLYDFCSHISPAEDVYRDRPDRVREYWQMRSQLGEAIFRGEEELAALLARRCTQLVSKWMMEDVGTRNAMRPFLDNSIGSSAAG